MKCINNHIIIRKKLHHFSCQSMALQKILTASHDFFSERLSMYRIRVIGFHHKSYNDSCNTLAPFHSALLLHQ